MRAHAVKIRIEEIKGSVKMRNIWGQRAIASNYEFLDKQLLIFSNNAEG